MEMEKEEDEKKTKKKTLFEKESKTIECSVLHNPIPD